MTNPDVARWPIEPLGRELTPEDRLPVLDPAAYRELSAATFRLPTGSPARRDLISLAVRVGNAAAARGDDELRFATYARDVELRISDPRWLASDIDPLYRGIEGMQQMLARLDEAFGEMRWENHEILDGGGNRFAIRLEFVASGRDSGIEARQEQWHVFTIEGGLGGRQVVLPTEEEALAMLTDP